MMASVEIDSLIVTRQDARTLTVTSRLLPSQLCFRQGQEPLLGTS